MGQDVIAWSVVFGLNKLRMDLSSVQFTAQYNKGILT